jgi:hypothetical protein
MARTDQIPEVRIHGSSRRTRLLALAIAPVLAITFALGAPAEARASHTVWVEPAYCDGFSNSIVLQTAIFEYTWVILERWDGREWRFHLWGGGVYGYQFHGLSDGYYRIRAIGLDSVGNTHWAVPSHYRMAASVLGQTPTHPSWCRI